MGVARSFQIKINVGCVRSFHMNENAAEKYKEYEAGMQATEQRPLLWETLTWEEVGSLRDAGVSLCLLPVGATEQHGPHLGVGMDSCNAALLCEAVSRETGVPVLPALGYGCSLGHSHRWPGTLSL